VFRRHEDGFEPGALVVGPDGALYGRTKVGPVALGWGTAFRWSPDGGFSTLHQFSETDGLSGWLRDNSPFLEGGDGYLYGLTDPCNPYDCGQGATLFRMSLRGDVTQVWSSLHNLRGPLVRTPDGSLWGSEHSATGLFVVPPIGAGRFFTTDHFAHIAAVSSDGALYGFAAERIEPRETDVFVAKILPANGRGAPLSVRGSVSAPVRLARHVGRWERLVLVRHLSVGSATDRAGRGLSSCRPRPERAAERSHRSLTSLSAFSSFQF
jgi:uncharacterized repeat protein (TIGR03803 family)